MSGAGAETRDVVIVGAGPAGLGVARGLLEQGVRDIVVLDREDEAGGVPRHCGHTGFGVIDFKALLRGPALARRMIEAASGAEIRTHATVTGLKPGGLVEVSAPGGPYRLQGRRVVLATGVYEMPRSARLISGSRPWGVMSTGALQQFVYLSHARPFRRVVILGSELVSFSALLTLRHGGMEALAMVEPEDRITAYRPAAAVSRLLFRVPVLTRTRLHSIRGKNQVEGVVLERTDTGEVREIACDGVIVTGRFRPEATLLRASHLLVDPGSGGARVDQFMRCSDPAYFACGNMVHPVETAGYCYREGLRTAHAIARDLRGALPPAEASVVIEVGDAIRYACPQVVAGPLREDADWSFNLRATRVVRGRLEARSGERLVWSRRVHALPERRFSIGAGVLAPFSSEPVRITLTED